MKRMGTWPSLYEYAMAHACPACLIEAGVECNAPNKQGRQDQAQHVAAEAGQELHLDPIDRLHRMRQLLGMAHYRRDIASAPWPEDRVPGRRYDTLGDVL